MMLTVTGWILSAYVLLATHLLFQHRCTCEGVLQCVCTTVECRRDRMSSCQAKRMCYEQRLSGEGQSSRSPGGQMRIVRGCIDDNTPLLCRNQKPNWFSGSWPLLKCCAEDWCNRPNPTETGSGNEPDTDTDTEYDDDNEYYEEGISVETSADDRGPSIPVADHPKKTSPPSAGHRQRPHNPCGHSSSDSLLLECPDDPKLTPARLNLLYVLVPVSGACALLALCATAFVVLRRGESPESHRGSNPSDGYVDGGRRNVLERDRLRNDLEENAFGCHRKSNRWSVDARKNRKDPFRTASRTYIDSRIFAA